MKDDEIHLSLSSWRGMFSRCYDPLDVGFARYGGRGIKVCERWFDLRNFLADMGPRPLGRSLDRIENDGHYTPDNCRWATAKEQSRNSTKVKPRPSSAGSVLATDLAKLTGLSEATVSRRLAAGKTVDEITAAGHLPTRYKIAPTEREAILRMGSSVNKSQLARQFGVSHTTIQNIIKGQS